MSILVLDKLKYTPVDQISCSDLHDAEIQSLICDDYLQFCLRYSLGSRLRSFVLNNGTTVDIITDGLIVFNRDKESPKHKNIVLSCGIHGNETAPIEICNDLIRALLHESLYTEHRVLFIFGNIPAMQVAQRFVQENLNRLFSRQVQSSTLEGERAVVIMDEIDAFFADREGEKLHYDLHTAIRPSKNEKFAVYPFLHGAEHNKRQLAFLSMCGVNTILLSQSPTTTFSYYSSNTHGAHAFTVELGKVFPFGENDMTTFSKVISSLKLLLSENSLPLPEYSSCPLEIFTVAQVINKQQDDFTLTFDDDTANFTEFSKGDLLAYETGKKYYASQNGEAVVFPNANVAIGQRAILTVVPFNL